MRNSPALWPRCRSLGELGDPKGKARHFVASIVLMRDAALRRTHDGRFRFLERRQCRRAVAAGDRFLDLADRIAQQQAAGDHAFCVRNAPTFLATIFFRTLLPCMT
jgi:hypothetical protein